MEAIIALSIHPLCLRFFSSVLVNESKKEEAISYEAGFKLVQWSGMMVNLLYLDNCPLLINQTVFKGSVSIA